MSVEEAQGGGIVRELLRLVARLKARHGRQSAKTVLLGVLLAGTEGIGIVLLIPLLALAGLSSGESAPWLDIPGLQEFEISTNIYAILGVFLALLALRQWIVFRHKLALTGVALDFVQQLREDFFKTLVLAEWRFFSTGTAHRHSQILTHETARSGNTILQCFALVGSLLVALVQIAIAAFLSVAFTLAALAAISVFALFLRKKVQSSAQLGIRLTERNEALYAMTSNLLPLLRTTKMSGNADELTRRFAGNGLAINDTVLRHTRNQTAVAVKTQFLAAVALAAALIVGVQFLALAPLSATILILLFARLTPFFIQAMGLTQDLAHNVAAVSCSLDNIALWQGRAELSTDEMSAPVEAPRHALELRAIAGGHAERDQGPLLSDISITLPVGSTTLLNGPTGSGKSTLADIIVGLLPPTSGSIMLDGRALSAGQMAAWRRKVGYVEQASAVFTGTLRENLMWGAQDIEPEWFSRVLEACMVTDFLDAVAGGLDGSIGESGAMLSGGQKQRVAIARELLRKPALLVLDEATAGLDELTESRMLRQIAELDPSLTTILISHRPSAERFADRIIELENGRIKVNAPKHERADEHALSVRA